MLFEDFAASRVSASESNMPDLFPLLLTLVPWIELRGSIPLSIAVGLDPFFVLIAAIVLNIALFFPLWFCLELLYNKISHKRTVRWAARHALKRKATIEKWGMPGLAILVAIPAPFTGVWTATILAWLLRMPPRPALVAIATGVVIAATIVFLLTMGALSVLA